MYWTRLLTLSLSVCGTNTDTLGEYLTFRNSMIDNQQKWGEIEMKTKHLTLPRDGVCGPVIPGNPCTWPQHGPGMRSVSICPPSRGVQPGVLLNLFVVSTFYLKTRNNNSIYCIGIIWVRTEPSGECLARITCWINAADGEATVALECSRVLKL